MRSRCAEVFSPVSVHLVFGCTLANVIRIRPTAVHGWLQVATVETAVYDCPLQRQVPSIQNIQKSVEVPQVHFIDKTLCTTHVASQQQVNVGLGTYGKP